MPAYSFKQMVRRSAITSINAYQRYLSPRKGFACPHRMLYQETSCSEYMKRLMAEKELLATILAAPARFMDCQQAAAKLLSTGRCQSY